MFALLDLDENGEGRAAPREKTKAAGCGEHWKSTPFTPNIVQFRGEEDTLREERIDWQNYVEQDIATELMKLIADCTNAMSLANSGRSLNTSVDEIYHFFGAAILVSCVPYPQTRMFWSDALRISANTDTMTRGRFFKLRSNLKVFIDNDVSQEN